MITRTNSVRAFLFIILSCFPLLAQTNNNVAQTQLNANECQTFIAGKVLSSPRPSIPAGAKSALAGGKVEVTVDLDEQGNVIGIQDYKGDDVFKEASVEAAKQAKFSPPMCDGKPSKATGVLIYNFATPLITSHYFAPAKIGDLVDVSETDDYYEALVSLIENYKIGFGYADKKYHAEMPLTGGDFAYFLDQTLSLLDERAKQVNKIPSDLGIYKPFNPYDLKFIEFNPRQPSAHSLRHLLENYGVVLADKDEIFDGSVPITRARLLEIWQAIFGEEAIPVNFRDEVSDIPISRGEFAIFLNESMGVLTYKVSP